MHSVEPRLAHGACIGSLGPGDDARETERVRARLFHHTGVLPALEHPLLAHRLQAYSCVRGIAWVLQILPIYVGMSVSGD